MGGTQWAVGPVGGDRPVGAEELAEELGMPGVRGSRRSGGGSQGTGSGLWSRTPQDSKGSKSLPPPPPDSVAAAGGRGAERAGSMPL